MTYKKVEEMITLISGFRKYSNREVFTDFIKIAAIIHQKSAMTILGASPDELEKEQMEYNKIIKKYSKAELDKLIKMFALFIEQLEESIKNKRCDDILGYIFTQLNLNNKSKGQFFTPEHLAEFMSYCVQENAKLPLSVADPCCGSGVLLLQFATAKLKEDINVGYNVVFYGTDIDELCAMMTFVQLGYYGFSAIVDYGNALTGEVYKRYFTLVYALHSNRFKNKLSSNSIKKIPVKKVYSQEGQLVLF